MWSCVFTEISCEPVPSLRSRFTFELSVISGIPVWSLRSRVCLCDHWNLMYTCIVTEISCFPVWSLSFHMSSWLFLCNNDDSKSSFVTHSLIQVMLGICSSLLAVCVTSATDWLIYLLLTLLHNLSYTISFKPCCTLTINGSAPWTLDLGHRFPYFSVQIAFL